MWDIIADLGWQGSMFAGLAVCAAAFIQSLFGVGFGLFGAPLLALVDPRLVPATLLFLGFFAAILPTYVRRGAIDWELLVPSVIGRIAGSVISAAIIAFVISNQGFETALGIVILASVVFSATPLGAVAATRRNMLIAGTASGLLGTFVGVGGAPMGVVYQRSPPVLVRANMSAFFAIGGLVSFLILAAFGVVGPAHVGAGAVMLPPLFAGFAISRRFERMTRALFRPLLLGICALSAVALILRGTGQI